MSELMVSLRRSLHEIEVLQRQTVASGTEAARVMDLRDQLAAFNEERRKQLDGVPIDPEGVFDLLPPWGTPGGMGPGPT